MGMCRLIATHFLVLPGVIGGDGADAGGRGENRRDGGGRMGSAGRRYAGVGSRKTPTRILERMEAIAEALARRRDTPEGGPP